MRGEQKRKIMVWQVQYRKSIHNLFSLNKLILDEFFPIASNLFMNLWVYFFQKHLCIDLFEISCLSFASKTHVQIIEKKKTPDNRKMKNFLFRAYFFM